MDDKRRIREPSWPTLRNALSSLSRWKRIKVIAELMNKTLTEKDWEDIKSKLNKETLEIVENV